MSPSLLSVLAAIVAAPPTIAVPNDMPRRSFFCRPEATSADHYAMTVEGTPAGPRIEFSVGDAKYTYQDTQVAALQGPPRAEGTMSEGRFLFSFSATVRAKTYFGDLALPVVDGHYGSRAVLSLRAGGTPLSMTCSQLPPMPRPNQ
jgi:hypothetical protein